MIKIDKNYLFCGSRVSDSILIKYKIIISNEIRNKMNEWMDIFMENA